MPTHLSVETISREATSRLKLRQPAEKLLSRDSYSELWVSVCFALMPFVLFAVTMLLTQGMVSEKFLNRSAVTIGEVVCVEGAACL